MMRMTKRALLWHALSSVCAAVCAASLILALEAPSARAATGLVASPADNLLNTTNYSVLGPNTGYWFANFGNPLPVTGAPLNSFEASNIPFWIRLDTNPAHAGMDDTGNPDTNDYTGYSFEAVSDSTGGQPGWNVLTLPDGLTGLSGAAVDADNPDGSSDNWVRMRFLPGAPSTAKFWVVTDNWGTAAVNANPNSRIRVRIKLLDGSFGEIGDGPQVETNPASPLTNNGTADAYAFELTNITPGEALVIRPNGPSTSHLSIAGVMFSPIPEPSSIALLLLGAAGLTRISRRRRG